MTKTLRAITSLFAFQLFARGLDYATGNPQQGVGTFQVESVDPPIVWGAFCIIAALMVAAGLIGKWNRIVRDGSILAAAIYVVFAVMVTDDISISPPDDWRFFTGYMASAGVWSVIAASLSVRMAVDEHRKERDGRNADSRPAD